MASAKIIELDDNNICKICENALGKYSCPRCNILYCSVTCYQSASHLECSENFYKDCIVNEISAQDENDADSKAKMMEILNKFHDENNEELFSGDESIPQGLEDLENLEDNLLDSDDEEYLDIAERLAGVNLDDAEKVWEKLTEDERQEFVAFLRSEDVTKLIPSWEPWWLYSNTDKVEEIGDSISKEKDFKQKCPALMDIKLFKEITSKSPANCVKYNLINILAAYVFTTRYFNGEHFDFAKEAVSCFCSISLTIKVGQNFEDFETAVKSVEQECINSDWIMTDKENIQIMREDVEKILKGPNTTEPKYYILSALSDLCNLLNAALKPEDSEKEASFSKKFPNAHFPHVKLEDKDKIKSYIKKIEYLLSYSKDCFAN